MGKYNKKPKTQRTQAIAGRVTDKHKAKKNQQKGRKSKGRVAPAKGKQARAVARASVGALGGDADASMSDAAAPAAASDRSAAEKLVSFLSRAKTESKAMEALRKALANSPDAGALGAALGHCAGRGLATCVRLLLENGAPADVHNPLQPPDRTTPLQLAASRGHVNVCRALVEAGADRTGAAEACQALAQLGAVFAEERKAIQALLMR
mmetsp:Transcript_43859/g.113261  ORF Transcript_43859/g.113261 Transcript_43859/m.113261 type:complete len:209 (-) Transcript_43859:41-667(-)